MPGWHCAKVMVEDQTAQQRYIYPCDRWGATCQLHELQHLTAAVRGDSTW